MWCGEERERKKDRGRHTARELMKETEHHGESQHENKSWNSFDLMVTTSAMQSDDGKERANQRRREGEREREHLACV